MTRFTEGHLAHDVEGHIVEFLNNVHTFLPTVVFESVNSVQEVIGSTDEYVFVLQRIGHAECKASHPHHTRVIFSIAFVDVVHGTVDFWCGETRVFYHIWRELRAKAIDYLLS